MHVNVRLDSERLCLLVLIGVRTDDTKELVALADGYWESAGSWADLLHDHAGVDPGAQEPWGVGLR